MIDQIFPEFTEDGKIFISKINFYDDGEIELLREKLDEFGLQYEIIKELITKNTDTTFYNATLYDIELIFTDDADSSFYQVLISEL